MKSANDINKYVEERPWGGFERFTQNENTTVKILTVKAGEAFSLQTHAKRSEFWKILYGNPLITIGEKTSEAKPGDEFSIAVGEKHRAEAGENDAIILEISFGDFDENDITRLDDKYNRT